MFMAQIETTPDFYNEILTYIRQTTNPDILAGDFNLILDLLLTQNIIWMLTTQKRFCKTPSMESRRTRCRYQ